MKTSSASPDTNCHSKVLIRCCAGAGAIGCTILCLMSPPVSRNAGVKCPRVDHLLVSGCYSETASLCIIQHLIVMHCPQCQGHVLRIHKTTSDLRQLFTQYLTSRDLAFKICLLLFRTSKNVTCILLSVIIMNDVCWLLMQP